MGETLNHAVSYCNAQGYDVKSNPITGNVIMPARLHGLKQDEAFDARPRASGPDVEKTVDLLATVKDEFDSQ
jgi:hypothetical protein